LPFTNIDGAIATINGGSRVCTLTYKIVSKWQVLKLLKFFARRLKFITLQDTNVIAHLSTTKSIIQLVSSHSHLKTINSTHYFYFLLKIRLVRPEWWLGQDSWDSCIDRKVVWRGRNFACCRACEVWAAWGEFQ
jgi:hypothetical protein